MHLGGDGMRSDETQGVVVWLSPKGPHVRGSVVTGVAGFGNGGTVSR